MFSKKFICATHDYSSYTHFVPSPYFRKTFVLERIPASCNITICGLGFYDLFINGRKITKGLLAPYISNPDHIIYYDRYDLTDHLIEGINVIGIQLGNGFQNAFGGGIWDFTKAAFRGAPRVAFAIEMTSANGETVTIEADESVKTAPSPLFYDDERAGCGYDARREIEGWNEPSFDDDGWRNALAAETPRGEARLCSADPIVATRHIRAKAIRKCALADYSPRGDVPHTPNQAAQLDKRVGYLYDFGINTAGIVRLKIRGDRGQQVDLQFGEYINDDGKLDYSNICFYPEGFSQRDIYILKGDCDEMFEPQFTYHGFRYCLVIGVTEEQATADLLTAIVCNSALEENADFRCSDEVASKLQAMTRNSTLSNFWYFPTDCPHREKNGWTGDAAASAEHTLLNLKAEKSYKEWLRNIRKTQREDGSLPGIIPTGGWGYTWGNGPAWDSVIVYLPYYIHLLRGDRSVLEENATAIFRYIEYLSFKRTERGTLEFGLGDWLPVTVVKSPLEFTDSAISLSILKKASFIFDVLGQTARKRFADELYDEIRASIRKHLVDFGSMTVIGNCQTSQAMAIYYGVFDEAEKPLAFKVLLDTVKRADDHIDCGFLGVRVLFRVLADFGESDLAFKMITRRDYPSYGNFVDRGFTALPECFLAPDANPDSLNHHFFGDISAFFIEYVAGIRPNPGENDPAEILVKPCFIKKLTYATAIYVTPVGKIAVKWERTGEGKISLTVSADGKVHGMISLPSGWEFKKEKLSFKPLESGTFELVDLDNVPGNILEI